VHDLTEQDSWQTVFAFSLMVCVLHVYIMELHILVILSHTTVCVMWQIWLLDLLYLFQAISLSLSSSILSPLLHSLPSPLSLLSSLSLFLSSFIH
jgi:hypothetical protein